jgi:hypothetical protein
MNQSSSMISTQEITLQSRGNPTESQWPTENGKEKRTRDLKSQELLENRTAHGVQQLYLYQRKEHNQANSHQNRFTISGH